ncbi:hypothetical protein HJC23_006083 [Cyclotella cryptica]|uniref:Uncharacterized protein n=1 Tax=Cyclotella cryptica TaxID=29204 RepID=A0ABD3QMA4_9STRA|eukprot:CCRYP_004551-RA/>CCRYP_004551-RA protein AED:0.02 eAED:0.02 QI:1126/-1/1/1/-1/1/1/377/1310
MAPREALNSYPDHYLTTDYYDINAPIMDGGGGGGGGGTGLFGDAGFDMGTAGGLNPTGGMNAPNATTPGMFADHGNNGMMTPVPSNNNETSSSNNVENDPLSMSQSHMDVSEGIVGRWGHFEVPTSHAGEPVHHGNTTTGGNQYSPSTMAVGGGIGSASSFGGGPIMMGNSDGMTFRPFAITAASTAASPVAPIRTPHAAGSNGPRPSVVTPSVSRSNSVTSSITTSGTGFAALAAYRRSVSSISTVTNPQDHSLRHASRRSGGSPSPSTPGASSPPPPAIAAAEEGETSPNETSVTPEQTSKVSPSENSHDTHPELSNVDSIDTMDKYAAMLTLDLNADAKDSEDGGGKQTSSETHTSTSLTATTALATTIEDSPMTDQSTPGNSMPLVPRPVPFGSPSISIATPGSIVRKQAFELSPDAVSSGSSSNGSGTSQPQPQRPIYHHQVSDMTASSTALNFGPETSISDLTYYAERGAIVDVLASLTDPHLKTLGTRMLADYAKMPHRRVAVASNTKILEFVVSTALEIGLSGLSSGRNNQNNTYVSTSWMGREYAVETVRSLTAAEENDRYLMNAPGLLPMLALVARGGPFVQKVRSRYGEERYVSVPPPGCDEQPPPGVISTASDKARLHACIAVMNLSCGKSNKVEITNVSEILEAMRDVMRGRHFSSPRTSVAEEARLKATTCIKNLSNADANDAALLGTKGLVETLGLVAEATCHPVTGATTCTTHACLALMNLSISKANKNRVFRTPGVMDALMAVITRTAPRGNSTEGNPKDPSFEARVKACSALSNLAIGYDNKIPMFHYPGFVESILTVIRTDKAEARTKACSILWSFAAEMKNQVPVVQRGDILPALVAVAKEDTKTEARFKCVAALTLLAESPENAVPLLHSGSLEPLMNVLQEAGPDPTQWKGQTASWCVGFLMNMAQCDDVVPALLSEGIVDLLAPLLALDHYQSLKAAMAVTFVCRYDTGDKTYNLLRQTENVIPKIVGLLHNTLSGRGGSGYKYGVFTLRSSVGCIASLASGPDFMKERIATGPVFESLLRVVSDFCVDGGTPGAIVGGGRDDARSSTLAVRALSLLTGHLIPEPGCSAMPFGPVMDDQLITALHSFEFTTHPDIDDETREMARSARIRIEGGKNLAGARKDSVSSGSLPGDDLVEDDGIGLSLASKCFPFTCGMNLHALPESSSGDYTASLPVQAARPRITSSQEHDAMDISDDAASATSSSSTDTNAVRTFLLTDSRTGRRFAVPCEPSGGRAFNDNRVWCFRRGRWCRDDEQPDSNFQWSDELQAAYTEAINEQGNISPTPSQL